MSRAAGFSPLKCHNSVTFQKPFPRIRIISSLFQLYTKRFRKVKKSLNFVRLVYVFWPIQSFKTCSADIQQFTKIFWAFLYSKHFSFSHSPLHRTQVPLAFWKIVPYCFLPICKLKVVYSSSSGMCKSISRPLSIAVIFWSIPPFCDISRVDTNLIL